MEEQLEGVAKFPMKLIADERGCVYKITHPPFIVRDVYTTTVRQGAIKGWHGYYTKTIYWTVVSGLVKLVLYDHNRNSPSYGVYSEYFLGDVNPQSILVPPGVFSAFKGISQSDAVIVVQADETYSDSGIIRQPVDYFDYDWRIKHG